MALPAHLPFLLPFGWTTRVTVSKQALARHRPLSPLDAQSLGQANKRELTKCWEGTDASSSITSISE